MTGRALCRLADVPDGGSAAFEAGAGGGRPGFMVLRRKGRVFVYVNRCPHVGLPLDLKPGRFLDREKTFILCTNHGALFRIEDGTCVSGPCAGDRLEAAATEIRDGAVYITG